MAGFEPKKMAILRIWQILRKHILKKRLKHIEKDFCSVRLADKESFLRH